MIGRRRSGDRLGSVIEVLVGNRGEDRGLTWSGLRFDAGEKDFNTKKLALVIQSSITHMATGRQSRGQAAQDARRDVNLLRTLEEKSSCTGRGRKNRQA